MRPAYHGVTAKLQHIRFTPSSVRRDNGAVRVGRMVDSFRRANCLFPQETTLRDLAIYQMLDRWTKSLTSSM